MYVRNRDLLVGDLIEHQGRLWEISHVLRKANGMVGVELFTPTACTNVELVGTNTKLVGRV